MSAFAAEADTPGILESMWRYRWSSLAIVLVAVALSVIGSILVAPRAQATATIALATPSAQNPLAPGIQGDASLARYTAQRAGFVTSDAVLALVAEELGRDDLTELRRQITARASTNSNTITVSADGDRPDAAVSLADAVVRAYRSATQAEVTRLTDTAVASIEQSADEIANGLATTPSPTVVGAAASTLSELQLQATDLRTTAVLFGDGVESVIAPRTDAVASPGLPRREALVGLAIGLVIAATVAWMRADRAMADEPADGSDDSRSLFARR